MFDLEPGKTIMRRKMIYLILMLLLVSCGQGTAQEPTAPATAENLEAPPENAVPNPTIEPTAAGEDQAVVEDSPTEPPPTETIQQPTAEPEVQATSPPAQASEPQIEEYDVPAGARPHDVAPAPDGTVWYTAQHQEALGRLDPATSEAHHVHLGSGSAPHGVIVGPDGAAWVTDGGLNAIVRVDGTTEEVQIFPLPEGTINGNLNTAVFDNEGILWFTGQSGIYGRLDPQSGQMEVFESPRGRGPYGITAVPEGTVYYASLAGSYVGQLDMVSGEAAVIEPPTAGQGARRVWSDSNGIVWVSEWNAAQLGAYDPQTGEWREWPLPGNNPQPYAIYVDDQDIIWLSDFGANAIVRFDPAIEEFEQFPIPSPGAAVRQILGRPGEVWGAESATDKLIVIRTGS